ncbi:insulinase family protein [Arenibacter sp. F20364]|uniref:M16 family metallopeptidase n=1 Tax=Arenibacter sp. F20364 TaxID=2926415 RepID=UPI001FF55B2C|nr:insulinase family protein [Arenibacter sp. F20364]MCK0191911.1 insulinase family protein [Arenibacter sp. F20364]
MNNIKRYLSGLGIILLLSFTGIHGQSEITMDRVVLDPDIKYGKLPNGFTYYIKHLDGPSKKMKVRLYVKVGSHNEEPGQLDFAHALEHLAFKCSKDFPVNLLDNPVLLSRLGMDSGDIFGQTTAMSTWYSFDVPNGNREALDTALHWFQNISDLDLSAPSINKEKGPLRQEQIYRQGDDLSGFFAKTRMESSLFPCKQDFSNFFEINKNFTPNALIDFYKKWYRPDRMALVIVGDTTNIVDVVDRIKLRFSGIKSHRSAINTVDCIKEYLESPDHFSVQQGFGKDDVPRSQTVNIHLYMRDKRTLELKGTWEGLQRTVIWEMLEKLVNLRFGQVGSDYGSSYSANTVAPNVIGPAQLVAIRAAEGQEELAIKNATEIIMQAKEFGFGQKEWEQVKNESLEALDVDATSNLDYWMQQLENYLVHGIAIPNKKNLKLQHWLRELSLEEFNAMAKGYLSKSPNDIGIIAPPGDNRSIFSEVQVRNWISEMIKEGVGNTVDVKVPSSLMSDTEISQLSPIGYMDKGNDPIGTKELVLDNGVKVILQNVEPSLTRDRDKISIHGFRPYGASCFPEEDYFSAINAPHIVSNSGVGALDKFQINRFLKNKSLWQGVKPYIKYKESGIKGTASKEDLETLFQLLYLYVVQPRKDIRAFEDWKSTEEQRYFDPTYGVIQEDFNVLMRKFIGDYSKIPQGTIGYNGIKKTKMERAMNIYGQLIGNSTDYTFMISGDFSTETITLLVQKYLGNLPSKSEVISCTTTGSEVEIPKGPIYREFYVSDLDASYEMKSVRYSLNYVVNTNNINDWREQIKMEVLGSLMNSKIQELRYRDEAALYNVWALTKFNRESMFYTFQMQLDCVREELEGLREICKEFVSDLKKGGFDKERFNEVIGNRILPKYSAEKQSLYKVCLKTYHYYKYGESWVAIPEIERYIKSLNLKDIENTAKKYLKDKNLFEFVLKEDKSLP